MLVDALRCLAEGDRAGARAAATADPGSPLARQLARFLDEGPGTGVYDSPAAFRAFVRGGGNVDLYSRVSEALALRYGARGVLRLLDIGCGDGLALVPALEHASLTPPWPGGRGMFEQIDLVEPVAALLDRAVELLGDRFGPVVGHGTDASAFVGPLEDSERWEVVQSTFALHALAPDERSDVLVGLRAHSDLLLVAEFDVPAFEDRSVEHLAYLADRYERGLAEYDGDLVAQGFLLPVLTGQLDPSARRHTWEQPIASWADQLGAAGFADVTTEAVSPYWWADAHLLVARP